MTFARTAITRYLADNDSLNLNQTMTPSEQIKFLLEHPDELLKKKPFTRGQGRIIQGSEPAGTADVGETVSAVLPDIPRIIISQDQIAQELDPNCHKVLFDDNVPSITVKTNTGEYVELEFKKMAIPFQKIIKNKHVLHLCGHPVRHTLENDDPSDVNRKDYATFKRYWKRRNQDGMRTRMVDTQMSYGDAGLLYYFDRNNRIKSRVISYDDGYVICPHNDANGDRLMESVYYRVGQKEYIDSYDDKNMYRHVRSFDKEENREWKLVEMAPHGFSEIPLVTKRGDVPWGLAQSIIEVYEIIYNIFAVIMKRHGWGILFIKGNILEKAKRIAGAVVLNDSSLNQNGDAKYLQAPTPDGMLDMLKSLEEQIQKATGTTFILPKDISTAGDISGIAIEITQSLDNEEALRAVIEWQNVASKMSRLFKEGLAKELVTKGDTTAITRFDELDVYSEFKQWRPRSDAEYNQMLTTLKGAGLISLKTGIEKNTESTPDEEIRISRETEEQKAEELAQAQAQAVQSTEEEQE